MEKKYYEVSKISHFCVIAWRNQRKKRNNNNNNNDNTCLAPISILVFSSALKNKNIRILRLHKVHIQKVHEPTKKSKTIM